MLEDSQGGGIFLQQEVYVEAAPARAAGRIHRRVPERFAGNRDRVGPIVENTIAQASQIALWVTAGAFVFGAVLSLVLARSLSA